MANERGEDVNSNGGVVRSALGKNIYKEFSTTAMIKENMAIKALSEKLLDLVIKLEEVDNMWKTTEMF